MLYPNLEAELSREHVDRAALAEVVGCNKSNLSTLLNGGGTGKGLYLEQAKAIQREFFPTMPLEYLFSDVATPPTF